MPAGPEGAKTPYSDPRLARLAEQIRRLSGPRSALSACPSGLRTLDDALGGGFARGAVHELLALGEGAAARTVALLTATRAADRHRWIFYIDTTQDFYPPAAAQLGVPVERLVVIRASCQADALWTCEQSLRCRSIAAVIVSLRSVDPYASRRLQLAAEKGGSLGLLIHSEAGGGATFAATRLRLEPLLGPTRRRYALVSVLKLRAGSPPEPFVLELPDRLRMLAGARALPSLEPGPPATAHASI